MSTFTIYDQEEFNRLMAAAAATAAPRAANPQLSLSFPNNFNLTAAIAAAPTAANISDYVPAAVDNNNFNYIPAAAATRQPPFSSFIPTPVTNNPLGVNNYLGVNPSSHNELTPHEPPPNSLPWKFGSRFDLKKLLDDFGMPMKNTAFEPSAGTYTPPQAATVEPVFKGGREVEGGRAVDIGELYAKIGVRQGSGQWSAVSGARLPSNRVQKREKRKEPRRSAGRRSGRGKKDGEEEKKDGEENKDGEEKKDGEVVPSQGQEKVEITEADRASWAEERKWNEQLFENFLGQIVAAEPEG